MVNQDGRIFSSKLLKDVVKGTGHERKPC